MLRCRVTVGRYPRPDDGPDYADEPQVINKPVVWWKIFVNTQGAAMSTP